MPFTAPSISLLIPVYNVERYLRACLDSVRAQTFTDFEAIIVNDGSTDGSRAIIQEYLDADARFSVIDKANSGYGASMNRGLDAARGEYVAILESDDVFAPDALETLHALATRYGVPAVKTDFWLYWSEPEERLEPAGNIAPELEGRAVTLAEDPTVMYGKPAIWSGLYRRRMLVENDIRFLETPGASYQDTAFAFKVWASCGTAAFTTKPILKYRQDNESSSVNSPGKVFCVCDEYAEMERWLRERPELRKRFEGVKERMKFSSYLWNADRLAPELASSFLERASEEFAADLAAGDIDFGRFELWAEADLRALIDSPETFREIREACAAPSKLNTFRHYHAVGGWPLVMKLLKSKLGRG